MKKIILFIMFVFLFTGCSANYNLDYSNNKYKENFNFTSSSNDDLNYYLDKNIVVDYDIDMGDIPNSEFSNYFNCYNKNISYDNDLINFELDYVYNKDTDINKSNIIHSLFNNISIDSESIELSDIKDIFSDYDLLDSINIVFTTDKYVIGGNYDKVSDNKYYWTINKDNYKNKTIKIKLSDSVVSNIIYNTNKNGDNIINFIIYIVIIVILIFIVILYNKTKKNNK